ncbi:SigE family RNA polymerase sigma factor [Nocardioides massiliensis]|uniref:RNA polymerase sigma-70 factor (Sigma-E family) n=1 Tax=Nocardioides massiliensis TaxID=1325935 RepID=A0ABT9NS26_9ACTN|nr:SigE family RNA polymerase sigma factor [Nocardioides massiliensis]MDP9823224.1 RNA polymerase sigma-70 factor (sigma-E family) [Nocardioides massiliensis]
MAGRTRAGFEELVHGRSPALRRTAYLLVGDRGLADDLLQEALVKTYVAWPRLRDQGAAEAYCRKAIVTTAISWWRRRSWSERPTDELVENGVAVDGTATERADTRAWMWAELAKLPPRQRAAVVLRFYDDLSVAEVAAVLNCSEGTVKSQVHDALNKLRAALGPDARTAWDREVSAR